MTMSTITAATLAPDQVEIRQFPRPDVGSGDMLVQIESVGICAEKFQGIQAARSRLHAVPQMLQHPSADINK